MDISRAIVLSKDIKTLNESIELCKWVGYYTNKGLADFLNSQQSKIEELEKENKELLCCGNCKCYELGMCYFIDYAPVGLSGCNYCKNWIKR